MRGSPVVGRAGHTLATCRMLASGAHAALWAKVPGRDPHRVIAPRMGELDRADWIASEPRGQRRGQVMHKREALMTVCYTHDLRHLT